MALVNVRVDPEAMNVRYSPPDSERFTSRVPSGKSGVSPDRYASFAVSSATDPAGSVSFRSRSVSRTVSWNVAKTINTMLERIMTAMRAEPREDFMIELYAKTRKFNTIVG